MQKRSQLKMGKKAVISCIFLFLLATAVFLWSSAVWAQGPNLGINYARSLNLPGGDPRIAIAKLVRLALTFVGIIAVIFIIYAGYLWTVSGGNPEKISRAKKTLLNAVIGLIIIIASLLIISFFINKWSSSSGPGPGYGSGPGYGPGIGALGNCAVESVYPEPYQRDVPRNTGIIVTFTEEVDPVSICGSNPCNGSPIVPQNVRIYKTSEGDSCPSCATNVTNVNVTSNDNKTFVFQPNDYLGSPSEYIWYTVYLANAIRKLTKPESIFTDCGFASDFAWQFEVSSKIDLTPPQVASVFPPPDNAQDTSVTTAAVQATGSITVNNPPQVYSPAGFGAINPLGGSPPAAATMDPHNQESGVLTVVILTDGVTASLSNGGTLLGSASTANGSVTFSGFLTITLTNYPTDNFVAGNSWNITGVTAEEQADTLTVGSVVYTFVSAVSGVNQIQVSGVNGTAANIAAALGANSDASGSSAGAIVAVTARTAGAAGNNIVLATNNPANLSITPLAGGADGQTTVTVNDQPDKARNAVIQINFNEAVNPLTLSGPAADVAPYIRVVDIGVGGNLDGKFVMSNQYRTVEFISNNLCGVNGCGEQVYCLPSNSNLRVELAAAPLAGCINCAAKTPFNSCTGGHCYNAATGENHPLSALPLAGVADMAFNSLDGNRDGGAAGPISFYNENAPNPANGDSYQWSFWISDLIDLTPPTITSTIPAHAASDFSLSDPVIINFDKLMMAGSLRTGQTSIFNGRDYFFHKLINLWSATGQPIGYWVTKEDVDTSLPPDGFGDYTRAKIYHAVLADMTSYRAQVGSGVKDIYQNCFRPSSGSGCVGTPSCCGLVPTAGSGCP